MKKFCKTKPSSERLLLKHAGRLGMRRSQWRKAKAKPNCDIEHNRESASAVSVITESERDCANDSLSVRVSIDLNGLSDDDMLGPVSDNDDSPPCLEELTESEQDSEPEGMSKSDEMSLHGSESATGNESETELFENDVAATCPAEVPMEKEMDSSESDSDSDSIQEDVGFLNNLLQNGTSDSGISTGELFILLHSYVRKHRLSKAAGTDMLQLLQHVLPNTPGLPNSWESLQKKVVGDSIKVSEHVFCKRCKTQMEDSKCPMCQQAGKEKGYVYVRISIEDQLKVLYRDAEFVRHVEAWQLKYGESEQDQQPTIRSVHDGRLYKKVISQRHFHSRHVLSWKLFLDGIPLSHSSNVSATPVFLMPNELIGRKRKDFTLLAGLWVGDSKPPMQFMLDHVTTAFNHLFQEGLSVTLNDGKIERVHGFLLSAHADLPAKALMANMNQFNGRFCCLHCMQQGTGYRTNGGGTQGGNVHTMPYLATPDPQRLIEELKRDAVMAATQKKTVNGIKGPSPLADIDHFDMVEGFSIDYMHQAFLGICRTLMKLWFTSKHHREPWYCGTRKDEVDERLTTIKPPSYIARCPRSIHTLKHWKASEYRSFLLYYLVVCMEGILPTRYLQHVALLSRGIYLCSLSSITPENLEESAQCFEEFVALMGHLYGMRYMSLNVHGLLHQTEKVQLLGGLHETSCFDFEDMMGKVKNLVHGTQYMHKQIVDGFLASLITSSVAGVLSPAAKELYKKMTSPPRISVLEQECNGCWRLVGKGKAATELMVGDVEIVQAHLQYKRAAKENMLITSISYQKSTRRIDHCVQYGDELYGLVHLYVFLNEAQEAYAIVEKINLAAEPLISGDVIQDRCNQWKCARQSGIHCLIPLTMVKAKCLFMQTHIRSVVCNPPNHYERD